MSFLLLPVRSDAPTYSFQTELESVLYTFTFTFNQRSGFWTMTIGDADGNIILGGIKLVVNWLLTARYKNDALPPGDLYVMDTAGLETEADDTNFGSQVLLVYRESTT